MISQFINTSCNFSAFWLLLMMKIEMNADKIQAEKRYTLSSINRTIESAFSQMQLRKVEDASGALLYRDTGNARDYGRFGRVVNTLKKQSWFMDNVSVWRLYDSDDSDNLNDCSEEDLLLHYQRKPQIGG